MLVDMCNVLADRKTPNNHALITIDRSIMNIRCSYWNVYCSTYSGVIKSESEKWQLEIEIFVNLRIWRMDIFLVIAVVITTALIKIPVKEVSPKFSQSCRSNCITLAIVSVGWWFIWSNTIHWIWRREKLFISWRNRYNDLQRGL